MTCSFTDKKNLIEWVEKKFHLCSPKQSSCCWITDTICGGHFSLQTNCSLLLLHFPAAFISALSIVMSSTSWRTSSLLRAWRWTLRWPSCSASSTSWTFWSLPARSISPRLRPRRTCRRAASCDSASALVGSLSHLFLIYLFLGEKLPLCVFSLLSFPYLVIITPTAWQWS